MKIYVTSIFVDDQEKAHQFYTTKLGFKTKHDIPVGEYRWLTLVSPDSPDSPQLLLEPSAHSAVPPFKRALKNDGIPFTSFQVEDIEEEYKRLKASGVDFTQEPTPAGEVIIAVLDDTCGNLIQLMQPVT